MAASAIAAIASAQPIYTRQDVDNGDYLEGFLTWNEGRGGISWSGGVSEDPGGPGADFANDTYVSQPLPRKIHLNASRLIWLDVYTAGASTSPDRGTSCSALGIGAELMVDGALLGGARGQEFQVTTSPFRFDTPTSFPPDPEGYGVCRIRIAAERSILEKGSVLQLRLTHHGTKSCAYGMGADHRSVLRLPFFSGDELAYRYPSYAHGGPSTGGTASGIDQFLHGAGIAGIAAPLLLVPRARRARVAALVLLLSLPPLAGCTSPSGDRGAAPGEDGAPLIASVTPAYQRGQGDGTGLGSVIGQVVASDVGRPVWGAYAALLGTAKSVRTDAYGRFVFKDLDPALYRLRVDADGYRPMEAEVRVVADLIARVNVSLASLAVGSPTVRPHVHDYWEGSAEKELMREQELGVACRTLYDPVSTCSTATTFAIARPTGEGYNSILPGSYDVNITLDWDPEQIGYATVRLMFQANNDPSLDNWSQLQPRRPGVPFHIATTWEMDDPGHQRFSSWLFQIVGVQPFVEGENTNVEAWRYNLVTKQVYSLDPASFRATVIVRKGIVPLEPAHPDPWRGQRTFPTLPELAQGIEGNGLGDWNNAWLPRDLVPTGTSWLDVYANFSRDFAVPYEPVLRYHTAAEGAPAAACWANSNKGTPSGNLCDGPDYRNPEPDVTGRQMHWRIPVQAGEADPYYARRSFWVFGLSQGDDPGNSAKAVLDWWVNDFGKSGHTTPVSLMVVAHRDVEDP